MDDEKEVINNLEIDNEVPEIEQEEVMDPIEEEVSQDEEEPERDVTSKEFIKDVYKDTTSKKGTKTSKDVMEKWELTVEEYDDMLDAMYDQNKIMHMDFLDALKSKKREEQLEEIEEKGEEEPVLNSDTGDYEWSNGLNLPVEDLDYVLEQTGAFNVDKDEGKRKTGGNIRTVEERLEVMGIEAPQIMYEEMMEGEKATREKNRLSKDDMKDIHDIVRRKYPIEYKEYMRRMGKAKPVAIGDEVSAEQQVEVGKPLRISMSRIQAIDLVVKSGKRREEDVRDPQYLLRGKMAIKEFLGIENAEELSYKYFNLSKEELEAIIPEIDKYIQSIQQLKEEEPESADEKEEVVGYLESRKKPDEEYKAALVLYDFIKEGGLIERGGKDKKIPLEKVGEMITMMAGSKTPSGGQITEETCEMVSNKHTLYRLYGIVENLNEIEGPNGQFKERVKISKNLKVDKEKEKEQQNSLKGVFGELSMEEVVMGKIG